jgi:anti-sigma regulatory factor (Ser/Thr protein kinase)
VRIILKDNGPGIPDVKKAMTEGFSTASPEARNLGFGAGMGLPNIKKYTDTLEIDTVVGKGTTLTFSVNL